MKAAGAETRKCPKEFQDRLTRMFGRNQFGSPNFIVVWGQSQFIRMGNVWRDRWGNERKGFRDIYQCHGSPLLVRRRVGPLGAALRAEPERSRGLVAAAGTGRHAMSLGQRPFGMV